MNICHWWPYIEGEIVGYFTTRVIVPISPSNHQIKRYLERKLEIDTMADTVSDVLYADILKIIPEIISEMCVTLNM